MNKIRVIDLLNKIANGEEVPKKIKLSNGGIFNLDEDNAYYCYDINRSSNWLSNEYIFGHNDLNEEIEILEEEKKIPEKIKIEQDTPSSNYYIRNEYGTKCGLTKHSKMIVETLNQVIDYLKSKGE